MALLAGCSAPQGLRAPIVPVTVAEIQQAVACEFRYALDATQGDGKAALRKWSAVVELSLNAKDSHNIVSGLGSMSAKVGNATIATASTPPSGTLDGSVTDKNTLAYLVEIDKQAERAVCAHKGSPQASSGLELAELLIGTAQVINGGGSITSSSSMITNLGVGPSPGASVVSGTVVPAAAAVRELIPTVKYERTFSVSRKVGGGLTFKIGEVSLALSASGVGRERKDNTITITMGKSSATVKVAGQDGLSDLSGTAPIPVTISLEDSIFLHRQEELEALRGLTPKEVIFITPPVAP